MKEALYYEKLENKKVRCQLCPHLCLIDKEKTGTCKIRKNHEALRQDKYADANLNSGNDVTYKFKREDGTSDLQEGNRCAWVRIDGSAVGDNDFLVLINMWEEESGR